MTINSQAKGKRAERDLAKWWRFNGYPDAERAVKTGTFETHDAGDLILEHHTPGFPVFRLCVEVKHHAGGLTDLQITTFCSKLGQQCVQSKSIMGVLVERRDRVSDPGRWWVYIHASDFALLELNGPVFEQLAPVARFRPVRVQLAYFAEMLRRARLAHSAEGVVSSAASDTRRPGTQPVRAQALGGT
jgi:hypothetical protein